MEKNVDNQHRLYRCNICDKTLSCYKSLWRHNNTFHSDHITNDKPYDKYNDKYNDKYMISNDKSKISLEKNKEEGYKCNYCDNTYKHFQSRWKHEQKCKKDLLDEDNKIIVKPIQNDEQIIVKPNIDQIINNTNTNNTNNNINNQINNTNNGTINNTNNIIINQFGTESLEGFTLKDILSIVKEGNNMPITCVKKVNFNKKYPENHSFCATTLEGKHFTRINHKTQKPEKINKVDFINEVLVNSLKFIQNISLMVEFDESFKNSIPLEHQQKIKDILANQEKFHDPKNKKAFFNCINDMSYNFKDIILETWKLIQPNKNINDSDSDEELLFDENYKYISSDDED